MRAERNAVDEEEEYREIGGYLPVSRQSRGVVAQSGRVTCCTKAAIDAFICFVDLIQRNRLKNDGMITGKKKRRCRRNQDGKEDSGMTTCIDCCHFQLIRG